MIKAYQVTYLTKLGLCGGEVAAPGQTQLILIGNSFIWVCGNSVTFSGLRLTIAEHTTQQQPILLSSFYLGILQFSAFVHSPKQFGSPPSLNCVELVTTLHDHVPTPSTRPFLATTGRQISYLCSGLFNKF